jgi:hypothetical protein
MEEYQNISKTDIEDTLSGDILKINRIVFSALLIGPFLFLLIVIYLYQQKEAASPDLQSAELIEIMIIIFFILAVSIYSFVLLFPKIFLRKENTLKILSSQALLLEKQGIKEPVLNLIGVDRTLMIIRLAMMEGVTLFALVILMLSVLNNTIYVNEAYWLLVIPWLIQFIFTLNNYFSKDKAVERIFNEILPRVNT